MIDQTLTSISLSVSPRQVIKGESSLSQSGDAITRLGQQPLIIAGETTLSLIKPQLQKTLPNLTFSEAVYSPDCAETALNRLRQQVNHHQEDLIIGVGGGKALDTAKLVAHQCQLPIVTIPTSGATCAAWTALSNVYNEQGAFQYDVPLSACPDLLILDYSLIRTAPKRTLIAGIGDALAKWYEASVSSSASQASLTIAAVQQARVLRDLLLQKSALALENPEGEEWREVVDATVLLAGVIGGLGGANCRTVAAHAVHNGLTHLTETHDILHGEKVAYGILVQLRLEEMIQNNQLAFSARQQLSHFYRTIGLPQSLEEMGLEHLTLAQLNQVAEITCQPQSDIHRLPFTVLPDQLVAAMVSTCCYSYQEETVISVTSDQ
ncbi:MAG: iron-containing alcohol dehydrogenase family protein [Microcystaceae cyanobacterium]